jgi:polyphosphate kinase 2 (PPK2 family)
MDLEARNRWVEFSRAKDAMFAATDIPRRHGGWSRRR